VSCSPSQSPWVGCWHRPRPSRPAAYTHGLSRHAMRHAACGHRHAGLGSIVRLGNSTPTIPPASSGASRAGRARRSATRAISFAVFMQRRGRQPRGAARYLLAAARAATRPHAGPGRRHALPGLRRSAELCRSCSPTRRLPMQARRLVNARAAMLQGRTTCGHASLRAASANGFLTVFASIAAGLPRLTRK
jgi:hypothetical protein